MDHLPVGGSDGSLERLSSLRGRHRVFTHINNTNPMLLEGSPERTEVTAAGWTVGYDGLHITL
jgi:pyrroloquinoline quinone biosynthesis protein B